MSRAKNYVQKKALEKLPGPAVGALGGIVMKGVDKAVEERWIRALKAADQAEGRTVDERVDNVIAEFRSELTKVGAATGAVAATPVLGTAAASAALAADLGWFAVRSTDLIMTIGAVYGRTDSTMEERRAWVLSILAFGEEAADQFASLLQGTDPTIRLGSEQAKSKVASVVGTDAVTIDALRRINASLAAQVAKKYGTRRSALALGKLLPFGIGAAVGGAANFAFVRVVGKQAKRFFTSALPVGPSASNGSLPPPPTAGDLMPPIPGPIETDIIE